MSCSSMVAWRMGAIVRGPGGGMNIAFDSAFSGTSYRFSASKQWRKEGVCAMSGDNSGVNVPFMQRVLDNPFLLLFIGVVSPTVLYTIWGVLEVIQIPVAK